MRLTSTFLAVLSSLSLVACGDDGGSGITPPIDATPGDGTPGDGPVPCTISTPNFGDVGALTTTAYFVADDTNPNLYRILFTADLEAAEPKDLFFFDIFTGYEPFGTTENPIPATAGTYNIVNNQLQYADCSVCLTLGSNAAGEEYEDDFMATGGSVTINEIGNGPNTTLDVTFTNIRYEQVTFSGATSTPVGNGCITAISNASFTGTMQAPPSNLAPHLLRPHTTAKARGLR